MTFLSIYAAANWEAIESKYVLASFQISLPLL